jgi:hypothetical protein
MAVAWLLLPVSWRWPLLPPLPAFVGLGAQKAGTTTLHALLSQHPQVHLPPQKELQFFSLHYAQGERWYRQQFSAAQRGQICGDITPYYLFHPWAPQRIAQLIPKARLIVLLRDPVERTLSHYFHTRRLGFEPLPLEQALAAEAQRLAGAAQVLQATDGRHKMHQECSYLSRSRYEHQLARVQALFAAEQLLVLSSEALFAAPEPIWQQLLAFLELEPMACPPLPAANAGRGEALAVEAGVRAQLKELLAPTYQAIEQQWGICWPLS